MKNRTRCSLRNTLVQGLLLALGWAMANQPQVLAAAPGAPTVWINGQTGGAFNLTNVASVTVELRTAFAGGTIFYTLDGSPPSLASSLYTGPFRVTQTVTLRAIAYAADFTTAAADPAPINLWRGFLLTVSWTGGGKVRSDPPGQVHLSGSSVTLTAVADIGWAFTGWEGDAAGTANPLVVTMDGAKTLAARFASTRLLTAVEGMGQVTKAPDKPAYQPGERVLLTAVPARYFKFVGWEDGMGDNPREVFVGVDTTYMALFVNTVPIELQVAKEWDRAFGGSELDGLNGVLATSDGGCLLAGGSYSSADGNKTSQGFGNSDYWVVKVDAAGNKQWDRAFGGRGYDSVASVLATSDGGYLLAGGSESGAEGNKTSPGFGNSDFWVVKLDGAGNQQWDRAFGGSGWDSLASVLATSDVGYLLAGYSQSGTDGNKTSPGFGNSDFWVVKLDGAGNQQWDRAFGGSGDDSLSGLVAASDGGYLLAGSSSSAGGGNKTSQGFGARDYWVVKLDAAGDKQWDRSYGGNDDDWLSSVLATSDGGYLLAGSSYSGAGGNKTSPGFGFTDLWVVKLDAAGNKQWDRAFGGRDSEWLGGALATGDGGYLLAGYSGSGADGNKTSQGFGVDDVWVVKVDAAGNTQWDRAFGGRKGDGAGSVLATSDWGYLVAGVSQSGADGNKTSPGFGAGDFWVAKVDAAGNKNWDRAFGGSGDEWVTSLLPASDGGYLLAGYSYSGVGGNKTSPGFGKGDYWVVKLGARVVPAGAPLVLVNQRLGQEFNFTNGPGIEVTLSTTLPNGRIHYTLDGSPPTPNSPRYQGPFAFLHTATIRAVAYGADAVPVEADPVRVNVWETYNLNLNASAGGSVQAEPVVASYASNSVVTLTAVAEPGWEFARWTGPATGTNPTLQLRMDRAKLVGAVFGTRIRTAVTGDGSIRLNPALAVYPAGSTVQAIAVAGAGSRFGVWGGDASGNSNPLQFGISRPAPAITASFALLEPGQAALTVAPNGRGRVLADPRGSVFTRGQVVAVRALPDGVRGFLGWAGDYTGDPNQNPITVTLDQSKVLVANFVGGDPATLGPVAYVDQGQVGPAGSFSLVLGSGIKGAFVIQTSTDLREWQDALAVTNETGTVDVSLPGAFEQAWRFHRARSR